MAGGWRGFLAPVGLVLVIVGVIVAVLAFVFVLLDLSGDFVDRVRALATLSLAFIFGGAAFVWLSASGPK